MVSRKDAEKFASDLKNMTIIMFSNCFFKLHLPTLIKKNQMKKTIMSKRSQYILLLRKMFIEEKICLELLEELLAYEKELVCN